MTEQQIYVKAIECDPNYLDSYNSLAATLSRGESITLNSGQVLTKQQLYLESLRLNDKQTFIYRRIGLTLLNNKQTITLPDGQQMSRRQLLQKEENRGRGNRFINKLTYRMDDPSII
ncbi:hypothetical protein PPL_09836 [Heterostelium album PN500]|uniref:Uncharacterized protein n=1 Tax=Heterostelium pallidum (strain ATCC 26659 / Pp 5 / PN500) TaxID=670386 RepID=D3BP73_HETP5|nr:hypothetical protein PPL_09836 [Heterostelium album PN500]EFA77083.1 hypothetical protein PPL_09836 [Heterostelium album PN500]|eukprot:XP_020429212.1 hypothetical protein PPL_09836 [Heterostelium album PN500]